MANHPGSVDKRNDDDFSDDKTRETGFKSMGQVKIHQNDEKSLNE